MTRFRTRRADRAAPALTLAAVALATLGLGACASDVPPPTAQLGAASQSILNAERAGAAQYAPGQLQSARDKLAAANAAMRDDNRTDARRLAEQAQMDADLAAAHSQSTAAQQAASAVRRDERTIAGSSAGTTAAPSAGGTYAPPYQGTAGSGTAGSGADARPGVPLTPGYRPPPQPAPGVTIVNPAGETTSYAAGSSTTAPYGALPQGTPLPTIPAPSGSSTVTPVAPAPQASTLPNLPGPTSWDTHVVEPGTATGGTQGGTTW